MNTDLPNASVCFGLYDGDDIVGFCGVLHQPHGVNKKLKRVSRLVILPDYQGIGLGTKFLNLVAQYFTDKGFDFRIVTSAKNMIHALNKSERWKMVRWSVNKCNSKSSKIDCNRKSKRDQCKTGGTATFDNSGNDTNRVQDSIILVRMNKKKASIAKTNRTKCKTAAFRYIAE